jgi:putative heme-binding domain-containing protein
MRPAVLSVFLLVSLVAIGQQPKDPNIADTPWLSPADEVKQFTVPAGFEVQLVAAEPDIDKPINLNFDDRGRLWVTCSTEYPYAAPPGKGKDRICILEDFAPDGKARKVTTWRNDLNIPIGLLPLPATKTPEALAYSIPAIWHLRDTTSEGKADEKNIIYKEYGHKDTHGMTSAFTLGFDGWVYACHGYSNTSTIKGSEPGAITMQSGNTYRFRTDGTRLEQFTWGQVNPFGLALDPWGYVYSADCHSRPIYQLIRGGYYPSFGKPHDGLGFAPEMCSHEHGSTAICGLVVYDADQFPAEYLGTAFIGNVVTNRINFDRIVWKGSSPRAVEQPDFMSSKDPWYRPVDIKLGPDGALYIADFYNRIIGHYEVPLNHPGRDRKSGRIWRIVWKGEKAKPAVDPRPDAHSAKVSDLIQDLSSPNLTVRMRATNVLAARGDKAAVPPLRQALRQPVDGPSRGVGAAHALWVLDRLGECEADDLAVALGHARDLVRVHAGRVLAERSKWTNTERGQVLKLLGDSSAHVQRVAAEALSRQPQPENLRPLLDLRAKVPGEDTHLLYTVRIALRNQLLDGAAWEKLGALKPADEAAIADVALGVPKPEAAAFLVGALPRLKLEGEQLTNTVRHVARYGTPVVVEELVTWAKSDRPENRLRQSALFKAVEKGAQERGQAVPASARAWAIELVPQLLTSRDGREIQAAGEIIGSLRLTESETALKTLATDRATADGARLAALSALATLDPNKNAALIGKVLADGQLAIELRERTAEILARLNVPASREQLTTSLASAPARLQTTIAAGLAGSKEGADALLKSVEAGKASARLLREKAVEVKLAQSNSPKWQERVAKLTAGMPAADQKIQELIVARSKGYKTATTDVEKGKAVFQKHCANCHQIGGQGQKIGPQLDGLGVRGLERILEDTIDPNRNIDAAFRATLLTLKNGQVVSGLVLREEGEVIVLADNLGKEVRVQKGTVDERTVVQLSPMPANLIDQIPEADYYHLLAYLLAQRPKE